MFPDLLSNNTWTKMLENELVVCVLEIQLNTFVSHIASSMRRGLFYNKLENVHLIFVLLSNLYRYVKK